MKKHLRFSKKISEDTIVSITKSRKPPRKPPKRVLLWIKRRKIK